MLNAGKGTKRRYKSLDGIFDILPMKAARHRQFDMLRSICFFIPRLLARHFKSEREINFEKSLCGYRSGGCQERRTKSI